MQKHEDHPLIKEVPGHLFQFEEKIFGMTLQQLLSDIGAGVGIVSLTASLPLGTRVVVCVLLTLPVLVLVHGKVQDQTFLHWLYLYGRSLTIPRHTTWQSLDTLEAKKKGEGPSVQASWIPLDSLESGIMGYSESRRKGYAAGRYWVVFEVEGRNIRYLPEQDQIRLFGRFESFLTGLEFRLQFISHTEQVHQESYAPLLIQKQTLASLSDSPHLTALQQASIQFQQQHLHHCTLTRHFVVISVSAREETARQRNEGSKRGLLSMLWNLVSFKKPAEVTRQQVIDQLCIRISVVKRLFQQLDVRAWLLDDPEMLRLFASCLAPGANIPSFEPQLLDEPAESLVTSALQMVEAQGGTSDEPEEKNSRTREQTAARMGRKRVRPHKKYIQGLHGTFCYESMSEQARFEAGVLNLADLVAPTSVEVRPDMVVVEVAGKRRYLRYFTVTGYGHHLLCGWVGDLSELGLPMLVVSQFDPIDTAFMIGKLEMHLVKLESQRISDQKTLHITKANQHIEAAQVRRVLHELAARRLKIFAVSMTIGIHASSPERLEQRSRYLLSHLRGMQLRVRAATRRHDVCWQSSLPICPPTEPEQSITLPSDVDSTLLHFGSGVIGTPTGPFLGFSGSGASRRPVYFNPWSAEKKIPNPHCVVVGETGMGKSWLGKTLVTGLMGLRIADVVVLDRDDDYLPLHEALPGESQRYNLARSCPINLLDIPHGPDDVDPDDPADLLSEFIDNHLMTGLALLIADAETKLTKGEEAYLTQVTRATYAAVGITSETIRLDPDVLLKPAPTLADLIATMKTMPASSESMRQSLLERLEKAAYLFTGPTSISISRPLTIFSIRELDEKWYPLMTYVVQNFLYRHRALRHDERYLAYVVEEASYMLRHPAGRRYLEQGSRGFRKLGIAQITLSQHPRDFLEEGQVILSNAGTAFFLGMQRTAAEKLNLSPELERTLIEAVPGQAVMRCGNEYASITIASSPKHRAIFTTDPQERRDLRERERQRQKSRVLAS
jgi:hypothetical protein